MNKKLKNMEYLLNFGSFILMFAIIFVVSTIDNSMLGLKLAVGVICSLIMLGISFPINSNLKLTDSSKLFHFESLFLLFWFIAEANVMGLFGEWLRNDGVLIFNTIYAVLLGIASLLTYVRYKNYMFINLSYIPFIIAIYTLFKYLSLSYFTITLIVMVTIFMLYTFVKHQKFNSFFRYLLAAFCAYAIALIVSNPEELINCIAAIVLVLASVGSLCVRHKDVETKQYALIMYYYLLGASIVAFNEVLDHSLVVIIVGFIACVGDLLFNYLTKYTGSEAIKFNKIVSPIFILGICTYALTLHYSAFTIISIFVFVGSLFTLYLFKGKTFEKYLFPFKAGMLLYSLLYVISENFFLVPDLVFVFALNLLYLGFYLYSKDEKMKTVYTVVCMILLFMGFLFGDQESVVDFVSILFVMLLDYLVLVIKPNKDGTNVGKLIFAMMLIVSQVLVSLYNIDHTKYLIETIFLLGLFISSDKVKFNIGLIIPLLCYSLMEYIMFIVTNEVISAILTSLIFNISLTLFTYYIMDKDKDRDILFTSVFTIGMVLFLLEYEYNMVLTIYGLSIIVAAIVTALKLNYKYLFGIGLANGVFALFLILNTIEGIPAAVYLLVLGFVIVGGAVYMINKYNKEDHSKDEEKEKIKEEKKKKVEEPPVPTCPYPYPQYPPYPYPYQPYPYQPYPQGQNNGKPNFCPECGTPLSQDSVFCTNCGKKVVDK